MLSNLPDEPVAPSAGTEASAPPLFAAQLSNAYRSTHLRALRDETKRDASAAPSTPRRRSAPPPRYRAAAAHYLWRMTMTDVLDGSSQTFPPIPADDPTRSLAVARSDDPDLDRVFVAGGLYTILLTGQDTGGRYSLIDMRVPAGGGPPPHRHDFEEMFTLTEGELEFTFRGETSTLRAGDTVNIPANAPHSFRNASDRPARMLCMCTPPGQEEFFLLLGDRADGLSSTPPTLTPEERAERGKMAQSLALRFRSEFVKP